MTAPVRPAPAIGVVGVSKRYGQQLVLDDVTFEVAGGEMLVVVGPSGSGKTTLLRILAGLERPTAGRVALQGRPAERVSPQARRFGVVLQEPALFPSMTVEENVAFGLIVRRAAASRVRERVDTLLGLTGLRAHRHKHPPQLSGGQRQRVALARALAFHPQAMLLDEPFTALDPVTRVELRREVRQMLRVLGVPVVFVTHDQEEALELADRLVVLNGGRIEQVGTSFDVYNRPANEFVATFLGAANVLLGRWSSEGVEVGVLRLPAPADPPPLHEGQGVKVIFRPEDAVLAFEPRFLDAPLCLGRAVVESVTYVGPTERMVVRAQLVIGGEEGDSGGALLAMLGGLPLTVSRTKWEATEMALAAGDPVVIGLKDYRVLPHYPLGGQAASQAV